jgi:hypothetical protein
MSFIIEQSIEIAAPAEIVWEVITDLPRYGEWNPFVVACRSSLEVGDPIEMRVAILKAFPQPQTEVVTAHTPGRQLCYGLAAQPLGALESRRCHDVQALSDTRAQYRSSFVLSGWLNPVVHLLLGGRLKAGFGAMTEAIRVRAEALCAERKADAR